ncbi:hypothetical protein Moror_14607 [Moniliophthora roreri MCA 2997]|uniref:F-box domain-containing protein n=1 Tax=Moniliophthora roreri (strain MCA 2997) TaxID=1381753 RepID=V2XHN8_MONRO|nr:hypothetical protein Moror_14607 [Moniliophthora roreri MCA 2997]
MVGEWSVRFTPSLLSTSIVPEPPHFRLPPSNRMPIQSLPNDVVELIIDQLSEEKHTLTQTSLVARAWVRRSRYHLLRGVRISLCSPRRLDKFMSICLGPLSTIVVAGFTSRVVLVFPYEQHDGPAGTPGYFFYWLRTTRPDQLPSLTMAEALFGNTSHLELFYGIGLPQCIEMYRLIEAGAFLRTTHLSIIKSSGSIEAYELLRFINIFQTAQIVTLKLPWNFGDAMLTLPHQACSPLQVVFPPNLYHVTMTHSSESGPKPEAWYPMHPFLSVLEKCPTLRSIGITAHSRVQLWAVDEFLNGSIAVRSKNLTHCSLHFPTAHSHVLGEFLPMPTLSPSFTIFMGGSVTGITAFFQKIDIVGSTNVKSLVLTEPLQISEHNGVVSIKQHRSHLTIASLLAELDNLIVRHPLFQKLEEIHFTFHVDFNIWELERAGWDPHFLTVREGSRPYCIMLNALEECPTHYAL